MLSHLLGAIVIWKSMVKSILSFIKTILFQKMDAKNKIQNRSVINLNKIMCEPGQTRNVEKMNVKHA